MTKKEKKFVLDILKRYAPKKAAEIELAEALKGEIVDTPTKPPVVDVVMKPLIKDKNLVPKKTPPIREKDLLANAPNDPDIIY